VLSNGDVVVRPRGRCGRAQFCRQLYQFVDHGRGRCHLNPAARKSASAGIAIGHHDHTAAAFIGDGTTITADQIGVGAETLLPVTITWDKWEGISSVLGKLNPRLGIEKEVFTSYANAQGESIDGGIYGSVNVFQVDDDTRAWVGSGAKLTSTHAGNASWQSVLDSGESVVWLDRIAVDASNLAATIDVGGNWSPISAGTGSGETANPSGAFNYVNYSNTTKAGVGAVNSLLRELACASRRPDPVTAPTSGKEADWRSMYPNPHGDRQPHRSFIATAPKLKPAGHWTHQAHGDLDRCRRGERERHARHRVGVAANNIGRHTGVHRQ
jgi:hypothetical protein